MTVEIYKSYVEVRKDIPPAGPVMPYGWVEFSDISDPDWMVYIGMFGEFSSEIANTINGFRRYIRNLQAWSHVIQDVSEYDKLEVILEFIDPAATIAVNLVNVIQSRIVFASAHLCHQANRTKDPVDWKDDLPSDRHIWPDTAHKYGRRWSSYADLKKAINSIGSKKFNEATGDFRDAYNHRFSSRFVIGITNIVTRIVDKETKQVCYGFGGREPHDLGEIVGLLIAEHDRCCVAFAAFQALVREHEIAIRESTALKRRT